MAHIRIVKAAALRPGSTLSARDYVYTPAGSAAKLVAAFCKANPLLSRRCAAIAELEASVARALEEAYADGVEQGKAQTTRLM